jgi:hypothetical protein
MEQSNRRLRHAFFVGATAVAVAAAAVAAVTSSVGAQPKPQAAPKQIGPGYPPPGGIYTAFTNCPILNPIMQETPPTSDPAANGLSVAACVAGEATSGTLTIGNIATPVVRPVNVQFGFFTPPNATFGGDNTTGIENYAGGILPPNAGVSAMLSTKPDLIPMSLTTALGCATATAPVVKNLCSQAKYYGGKYNDVYGLAQSAGQLTNFGVLSWTQRIKVKLINPLLGNNCYIGSDNNPIVVNPQLSVGPGGGLVEEQDPNPTAHPDTFVLQVNGAIASDTTFTAPGLTGCGPGGLKNIAVDEALDTSAGVPSASGANNLTLNGTFGIAATTAGEDSSLTQPQNNAKILISAFKASEGTPPPSAARESVRHISFSDARQQLHRLGLIK